MHIDKPSVIWDAWKQFAKQDKLKGLDKKRLDDRYTVCEYCPHKGHSIGMGVIDSVIRKFSKSKKKEIDVNIKKSAVKLDGIWCTSAKKNCNCTSNGHKTCVREDIHCNCPLSKTIFSSVKGCPEGFWNDETVAGITAIKEANPEATTDELKELVKQYLTTRKT